MIFPIDSLQDPPSLSVEPPYFTLSKGYGTLFFLIPLEKLSVKHQSSVVFINSRIAANGNYGIMPTNLTSLWQVGILLHLGAEYIQIILCFDFQD
jgi:hypothetical protein